MHRGKGMKFVGDSRIPAEKKPNIPKDYSEYPGKTEAFWPNFLLKEWMVGAVFLIGFLVLTIVHQPPLERMADPTDTGYIPLPDWYFLFLYQLLKYEYAAGSFTVVGAMIKPGLAFGALLLAPFLDRGTERRPWKRPVAVGMMLLAISAAVFLTWQSVATHDWAKAEEQGKITKEADIDTNAEGYKVFKEQGCISCHGDNLQGGAAGPSLVDSGLKPDEIKKIAVEGKGKMPAGVFKGNDKQLEELAKFISETTAK